MFLYISALRHLRRQPRAEPKCKRLQFLCDTLRCTAERCSVFSWLLPGCTGRSPGAGEGKARALRQGGTLAAARGSWDCDPFRGVWTCQRSIALGLEFGHAISDQVNDWRLNALVPRLVWLLGVYRLVLGEREVLGVPGCTCDGQELDLEKKAVQDPANTKPLLCLQPSVLNKRWKSKRTICRSCVFVCCSCCEGFTRP